MNRKRANLLSSVFLGILAVAAVLFRFEDSVYKRGHEGQYDLSERWVIQALFIIVVVLCLGAAFAVHFMAGVQRDRERARTTGKGKEVGDQRHGRPGSTDKG